MRKVLALGMNPGPFGMNQVGVPFGEIEHVRDWLGINVPIGKPPIEHPKRPIQGFECQRSEVSDKKVVEWAKDTFGTPEAFSRRSSPQTTAVFMEGPNRRNQLLPEKLPRPRA